MLSLCVWIYLSVCVCVCVCVCVRARVCVCVCTLFSALFSPNFIFPFNKFPDLFCTGI